ncbi:MAG: hypothetical protein ABJN75_05570 [Hoeflea sp.]|uniref:hypothetical protein n=1 Tax=Hoeflea sp. TaxID=1940281 RepID=UPI00329942AC
MGQKTEARIRQRGSLRATDAELSALVSQMACRCAKCTNYDDAPLARAMFQSVEERGQTLDAAAGSLGIDVGDGAYLLAGLRQDVAVDFALTLLIGRKPDLLNRQEEPV